MEENAAIAERRAKLKKERENLGKFTQRLWQLAQDNAALDAALDAAHAEAEIA
jgi:hypothetical protein